MSSSNNFIEVKERKRERGGEAIQFLPRHSHFCLCFIFPLQINLSRFFKGTLTVVSRRNHILFSCIMQKRVFGFENHCVCISTRREMEFSLHSFSDKFTFRKIDKTFSPQCFFFFLQKKESSTFRYKEFIFFCSIKFCFSRFVSYRYIKIFVIEQNYFLFCLKFINYNN